MPYLMEYKGTTAVPASIDHNKSTLIPAATPTSQPTEDPEETGQRGPWLTDDDRAARDSKLRSTLKPACEPVGPPERGNPFELVAEPIETDYSEVDAEEEQDLRRRRSLWRMPSRERTYVPTCLRILIALRA